MEYKKLFDAEYKVMQIVWDNEPFGSRELAEICFKELGWKKSTTYTMLKRLIEKGYTKNDNATVTSLISREEVQKRESKDFVDKNFEVILVNDGSTDNTAKKCEKFLKYSNFKYVEQDNQGQGSARNKAISMATGDYLVFLDADDEMHADLLNNISYEIDKNHKCDFIFYGYAVYENGERTPPFDVIVTLANHYNVSIDYIAGRTKCKNINICNN